MYTRTSNCQGTRERYNAPREGGSDDPLFKAVWDRDGVQVGESEGSLESQAPKTLINSEKGEKIK